MTREKKFYMDAIMGTKGIEKKVFSGMLLHEWDAIM